jgi:hypothetical protein
MRRLPSARIIEILLLMMLDREDETVDVLEAARAEGAVGFVLMFAPVLDPLASRSRFRHLMADVGHTLPRWRIGG